MTYIKRLSKDYVIYAISKLLSGGIGFLLLTFYTRILSPIEYGNIEMLTILSNFFNLILVMGMDSAQSMFFYKFKKEGVQKQAELISAILQWRIIIGVLSFLSFETSTGCWLMFSFGSTTLIVLIFYESEFAQPVNIFFGHLLGILVGILFNE